MTQDELAVGSGADIYFDVVGAQPDGFLEGRHGVFGMVQMFAPVRNGDHAPDLPLQGRSQQKEKKEDSHGVS